MRNCTTIDRGKRTDRIVLAGVILTIILRENVSPHHAATLADVQLRRPTAAVLLNVTQVSRSQKADVVVNTL